MHWSLANSIIVHLSGLVRQRRISTNYRMSKTSQLGPKPIVPIENTLWGGNNKVGMDCNRETLISKPIPNQYAGRPSLVWRKAFLPSQLDTDQAHNMREGSDQALNQYGGNPNQYAGNSREIQNPVKFQHSILLTTKRTFTKIVTRGEFF